MKPNIDPEFKALIPPLMDEEYAQLESNVLADGCRDPLVTWQGTLIDGHNRFEICTRHGIKFQTVAKEFADRSCVIEWIICNQFGRRNLSAYQRTKLALRLEETIAARAKANKEQSGKEHGIGKVPQNSAKPITPIETREEIAKLAGVSRDTVDKVKQIEKSAAPEIKQALSKGEISINKAHQTVKKQPDPPSPPIKTQSLKFSHGMGIFYVAKNHMDKISHDDTERVQALEEMISYCKGRIENKK
jgi:hypothetical protein